MPVMAKYKQCIQKFVLAFFQDYLFTFQQFVLYGIEALHLCCMLLICLFVVKQQPTGITLKYKDEKQNCCKNLHRLLNSIWLIKIANKLQSKNNAKKYILKILYISIENFIFTIFAATCTYLLLLILLKNFMASMLRYCLFTLRMSNISKSTSNSQKFVVHMYAWK